MMQSSSSSSSTVVGEKLVTFNLEDILIDRHLGSGSFASVFSFRKRKNNNNNKNSTSNKRSSWSKEHSNADLSIATTTTSTSLLSDDDSSSSLDFLEDNNKFLAMKILHEKCFNNPEKFENAALDLQNEVQLLSSLPRHPNIITLYGTSSDFGTLSETAFLVLERLEETLDTTIQRWKSEVQAKNWQQQLLMFTSRTKSCCYSSRESQASRMEKVMLGTARALSFLHSRNIVYRDLKPQNLGFDRSGNIKMFDFALAEKISPTKFQERVGTLRYMAPEVAMRMEYDLSVDIYSFGILLWEICTLQRPFDPARNKLELESMVIDPTTYLPNSKKITSMEIRNLYRDCCSDIPTTRPSFKMIVTKLQKEILLSSTGNHHNL